MLKDGVTFSIYSDHFKAGPDGLFGGTAGMQGHCHCIRDGKVVKFKSKSENRMRKGDVIEILLGGGGGYGRPEDRAEEDVDRDVADGLLSPAEAARTYPRRAAAE